MKRLLTFTIATLLSSLIYAQSNENKDSSFTQVDSVMVTPSVNNNIYILLEQSGKEVSRTSLSLEDNTVYLRKNILTILDEYKQKKDLIEYVPTQREKEMTSSLEKIIANTEPVTPQIQDMISTLGFNSKEQTDFFNKLIPSETIISEFEKQPYGKLNLRRLTEKQNGIVAKYTNQQPLKANFKKPNPEYLEILDTYTHIVFNFKDNPGSCQKLEVNKSPNIPYEAIKNQNPENLKITVNLIFCTKAKLN